MRRSHVYERSVPRGQRPAYQEPSPLQPGTIVPDAPALRALLARVEEAGGPDAMLDRDPRLSGSH